MRTAEHWEESNQEASHQEANRVFLQLKELAKTNGHDPKGIKLLSKKTIIDRGYGRANTVIQWKEGPDDWAYDLDINHDICSAHDGYTLIFF